MTTSIWYLMSLLSPLSPLSLLSLLSLASYCIFVVLDVAIVAIVAIRLFLFHCVLQYQSHSHPVASSAFWHCDSLSCWSSVHQAFGALSVLQAALCCTHGVEQVEKPMGCRSYSRGPTLETLCFDQGPISQARRECYAGPRFPRLLAEYRW